MYRFTEEQLEAAVERFAKKVLMGAADECWLWQGARHSQNRGYGKFRIGSKVLNAHKASYILFKGDIEDGLIVSHVCNNEMCVNPHHLEAWTQSVNIKFSYECGRHPRGRKQ